MKQDMLSFSDVRRLRASPFFVFLTACMLCGIIAGCLTGMRIPQADGSYAQEIAALLTCNVTGQLPATRTVLLCLAGTFGWPLALLLFGKPIGRQLWVALIIALRGFFLAFAVAAALLGSGLWGVYLSFVSIGISAALWVPALLLFGTACLESGCQGRYLQAFGRCRTAVSLCAALFLLSALWRLLVVPMLLRIWM